jgi:hypothetical protein
VLERVKGVIDKICNSQTTQKGMALYSKYKNWEKQVEDKLDFKHLKIVLIVIKVILLSPLYALAYFLGYIFLYGYYFGGINTKADIISLFLRGVPINEIQCVIVGILILLSLYILIKAISIVISRKITVTNIFTALVTTLPIITLLWITYFLFINTTGVNFLKIAVSLIALSSLPIIIVLMVVYYKSFNDYKVLAISGTLYSIIIFACSFSSTDYEKFSEFIFLMLLVFPPLLIACEAYIINILNNTKLNLRSKAFINGIIIYAPIIFVIDAILFKFFQERISILFILLTSILLSILAYITFPFTKKIISRILEYNLDKKDLNAKVYNINSISNQRKKSYPILISIGIIIIGVLIYNSINLIIYTSRFIRDSFLESTIDKIVYLNEKNESTILVGNIVVQKDGISYISKYPDRELIKIQTSNISSVKLKKFSIDLRSDNLENKVDSLIKNYNGILGQENIDIENKLDVNLHSGISNEIVIQIFNNNRKNRELLKTIILKTEYKIDEFGDLSKFYILHAEQGMNEGRTQDNDRIYSEIQKFVNQYISLLKDNFNISIINIHEENYYSNCVLVYENVKNDSVTSETIYAKALQ